jgi:RNA polymerase sigma-70 factor (ECF subfamily)
VSSQDDFERIFNECYEPVYRYAARRVAPEAAHDVVSDTFLVAWRRFADLDGEPLPWLLGIARRVASSQRRGSARRAALRDRLGAQPPPEATRSIEARDPSLASAFATLSARDREALMLVAWDGLEHRVAATVMGCSTGSLTVRVHRAKRRLARALAQGEAGEPLDVCEQARPSS